MKTDLLIFQTNCLRFSIVQGTFIRTATVQEVVVLFEWNLYLSTPCKRPSGKRLLYQDFRKMTIFIFRTSCQNVGWFVISFAYCTFATNWQPPYFYQWPQKLNACGRLGVNSRSLDWSESNRNLSRCELLCFADRWNFLNNNFIDSIGIKHDCLCINICWTPSGGGVLKPEPEMLMHRKSCLIAIIA